LALSLDGVLCIGGSGVFMKSSKDAPPTETSYNWYVGDFIGESDVECEVIVGNYALEDHISAKGKFVLIIKLLSIIVTHFPEGCLVCNCAVHP